MVCELEGILLKVFTLDSSLSPVKLCDPLNRGECVLTIEQSVTQVLAISLSAGIIPSPFLGQEILTVEKAFNVLKLSLINNLECQERHRKKELFHLRINVCMS